MYIIFEKHIETQIIEDSENDSKHGQGKQKISWGLELDFERCVLLRLSPWHHLVAQLHAAKRQAASD